MPIQSASISLGATVSASGGTAEALQSLGGDSSNRVTSYDDADYKMRTEARFSVQRPVVKPAAPNGYTQKRSQTILVKPRLLANGNLTHDTITITVSTDVETSAANNSALRHEAAQLLVDTDFTNFWYSQSTD